MKGGIRMASADKRTCPGCGLRFDISEEDYVKRNNRYGHIDCMKKKYPGDELEIHYHRDGKEKIETEIAPLEEKKAKPPKKSNERICFYCHQYINIETEQYCMPRVNRYAHKKCYEENFETDDEFVDRLYGLLTELNINYNFQMCEKQRKKFLRDKGYSNEGIYLTLKYFLQVKGGDLTKSYGGIGIVPFLYDEAKIYYAEMEKIQRQIKKEVKIQKAQERQKIIVKGEQKRNKKKYINLEELGG